MRLRAIEMLGAMGRSKSTAVLSGLYGAEGQSKDVRRAVINGLFISGDVTSLVGIARKETDPDLRKAAVERLSLMKSKEATDFLMELINK
jgi:HEAT repeat protein